MHSQESIFLLAVLHYWASSGVIVVDGQRGKSKDDERGMAKALAALHQSTNLQLKANTVISKREDSQRIRVPLRCSLAPLL